MCLRLVILKFYPYLSYHPKYPAWQINREWNASSVGCGYITRAIHIGLCTTQATTTPLTGHQESPSSTLRFICKWEERSNYAPNSHYRHLQRPSVPSVRRVLFMACQLLLPLLLLGMIVDIHCCRCYVHISGLCPANVTLSPLPVVCHPQLLGDVIMVVVCWLQSLATIVGWPMSNRSF